MSWKMMVKKMKNLMKLRFHFTRVKLEVVLRDLTLLLSKFVKPLLKKWDLSFVVFSQTELVLVVATGSEMVSFSTVTKLTLTLRRSHNAKPSASNEYDCF